MAKTPPRAPQPQRPPAPAPVVNHKTHPDHPDAFDSGTTSSSSPTSRLRIRVRATQDGYYDEKYYRTGDVLDVHPDHFADADLHHGWMEKVTRRTPTRITSSGEALERERGKIKSDTLGGHTQDGLAADDADIDPDSDPLGAGEGD